MYDLKDSNIMLGQKNKTLPAVDGPADGVQQHYSLCNFEATKKRQLLWFLVVGHLVYFLILLNSVRVKWNCILFIWICVRDLIFPSKCCCGAQWGLGEIQWHTKFNWRLPAMLKGKKRENFKRLRRHSGQKDTLFTQVEVKILVEKKDWGKQKYWFNLKFQALTCARSIKDKKISLWRKATWTSLHYYNSKTMKVKGRISRSCPNC